MAHAHWYLRFRRFKEEALDLRRSSNIRRSLYVAVSWGGWKDPLGIIVGGVDLGGMTFNRTCGRRAEPVRGRNFQPVAVFAFVAVVVAVVVSVVRKGGGVVVAVCHDVWW